MIFKLGIDSDERSFEQVAKRHIWIISVDCLVFFLVVIPLNHSWQGNLHEVTYFSSKLTMTVTDAEDMERREATDVWG
jgi:hypothetical protein